VTRLFDREKAGRPPRVRWALEEAGAVYDYVLMSPEEAAGEQHRRRHPLGRVPVLETDGGYLFESAALCLQVADSYPAAELIPPLATQERGEVYQWTLFAMSELEPALLQLYRLPAEASSDTRAIAERRLSDSLSVLERQLEGRSYLVADRFSVADIVIGGVLMTARRLERLPTDSGLNAYLERLDARPGKRLAYGS
jgi:glutathione S-transferase